MAGTPCENVIGQELCIYSEGVQQLFPDDQILTEMAATSYAGIPIFNSNGTALGLIAVLDSKPFEDISLIEEVLKIFSIRVIAELEREKAESKLRIQAKQQGGIAELGQYALKSKNLLSLMERAVNLVASILNVEYCKVLELLPDGKKLLLKAGLGWHDGLVGEATIRADTNSQAGYTLLSSKPVVVRDLLSETRFSGPNLLLDHQVISGMSLIILGRDRPFGILGIHTKNHRIFSQDDINFAQAIANILAEAIERHRVEQSLRESEQRYRSMYDNTPVNTVRLTKVTF